ncbi:hypothetical protein KY290_033509 [Solanum tuberosum]|uniref:DC1 domain-containing protein n=1 Tax=Solanum tuberosum TaxID=4113 RepID=A0ABQ7U0X6_SOLTU|nr:hypothetical protein KY289_034715 [Solanum tuberosum]KAH0647512.1 hypothetical protein KY285_032760 [Solanum tuberosum]KAH0740466.1 hypothetical protein KY290_033509 [Solanum tuberosum]
MLCYFNDYDQAGDQLDEANQYFVLYRFRQRQKNIQREIANCFIFIAKEEESCVSKAPPRLRDGDQVHFRHRHPLLRFHLKGREVIKCNMCTIIIFGVAYGCDCCHYFLHEVCSSIPKRIRHDFHPMHSLTLLPIPSIALWHSIVETEFCCVASGYDNSCPHNTLFSFYYHCDLCKFDLHLECASVTTKLIHKVKYPLDLFTSSPLKIEGAALVLLKKSLELYIGDQSFLSEVQKSLLLQKIYPGQQQKQGKLGDVTHFSHRHPLKAIKQTNEASIMSCCICSSQALSGYICQLCNYFIDETCFTLPRRIQHHFHPNHPLILAIMINQSPNAELMVMKKVQHTVALLVNSVSIVPVLVLP